MINNIDRFESHKGFFQRFNYQLGRSLVLEIVFLLTLSLTDFSLSLQILMQAGLLAIFSIYLMSHFSVPIASIVINYDERKVLIQRATVLRSKIIEISFPQLKIRFKLKFLMNYYTPVIEIRSNKKIIAVLPIKNSFWERSEIDRLIKDIIKLSDVYLEKEQYYVAENFYSFMPESFLNIK